MKIWILYVLERLGEICISGLNIALGYIDGEMHQQSFIANKFNEMIADDGVVDCRDHTILYKTGDFVTNC